MRIWGEFLNFFALKKRGCFNHLSHHASPLNGGCRCPTPSYPPPGNAASSDPPEMRHRTTSVGTVDVSVWCVCSFFSGVAQRHSLWVQSLWAHGLWLLRWHHINPAPFLRPEEGSGRDPTSQGERSTPPGVPPRVKFLLLGWHHINVNITQYHHRSTDPYDTTESGEKNGGKWHIFITLWMVWNPHFEW